MRSAALIVALACATVAHADGVRESRYGPERERAPTPMNGSPAYGAQPYAGRTLGWSGKRADVVPAAPQGAAPSQASVQPRPWWSLPIAGQAPVQPQAPQQASRVQIPRAPVQQASIRQAPIQQVPGRALPRNLYDAPPPQVQPPVQAQPQAYAPTYAPTYAQAPYAPPAAAPRALLPGQTTARTYSVGREFGLQPDPIPAAGPSRMVLVGPPATAPDDDEPTSRSDKKDDTQ